MGLHSDLDIYKAVYDLLLYIVRLVKNMPRDYKQAIGSERPEFRGRTRPYRGRSAGMSCYATLDL